MAEPEPWTVTCPECGSLAVPLLFGEPDLEGFQAAERGEIILAGCLVDLDGPSCQCPNGHRF